MLEDRVCILKNSSASVDETVRQIIQCSHTFPGILQEDAAVVPYLTVKETFDLFVSKARPKEPKVDLLVDDTFSEMELQESETNQTFDSLPVSLSLKLQWALNHLCQKKIVVVDRWIWDLSETERNNWFELFHASTSHSPPFIFVLADEEAAESFGDHTIHKLTEIPPLLEKKKEQ